MSLLMRVLLLSLALGATARPSRAHRVNVFALVARDSIHAEAYFADGGKCRNGVILLLSSNGDTLASVRTDGQGQAAVPLQALAHTPHADLRVVLDASLGHRAEYRLAASEIWPDEAVVAHPPPVAAQDADLLSAVHDDAPTIALRAELARQLVPLSPGCARSTAAAGACLRARYSGWHRIHHGPDGALLFPARALQVNLITSSAGRFR